MNNLHASGPVAGAPRLAAPDYAGEQPAPTNGPPSVGLLARLKLTEPVRLYLYSVATVVVAGLALAGVLTGDWPAYATGAAAVVLGVVPAVEAARRSTYSTLAMVQAIARVGRTRDAAAIGKALDL